MTSRRLTASAMTRSISAFISRTCECYDRTTEKACQSALCGRKCVADVAIVEIGRAMLQECLQSLPVVETALLEHLNVSFTLFP